LSEIASRQPRHEKHRQYRYIRAKSAVSKNPERGTSVPNPKFATIAAAPVANFGFERTLETYDSSVVLVQEFS
jgi:hypothetical protein